MSQSFPLQWAEKADSVYFAHLFSRVEDLRGHVRLGKTRANGVDPNILPSKLACSRLSQRSDGSLRS